MTKTIRLVRFILLAMEHPSLCFTFVRSYYLIILQSFVM